jgi:phage-related protein
LGGAFAASAKAAAVAVAAVAAATVAAVKGLADMTAETGVWADDLITLSNQTGIAQETLQGLEYASRFVDVSVEDMTKGMGRLVREMSAAQTAGEDYISTSDGMTIAIKDANGNFKDSEQLFYEAVDAIGAMEDETQKEIAAQELFGRSYQDIMPLINAGSDALREYTKEAEEMGYVLSTEQIAKLGEYDDLMQKTDAQMDILKRQLVTNFLPAFQTVGQGLSEVMSEISTALADGFQPEDVQTIGTMISEKLLEGVKTFSQYIPAVVETVTTVLTEAVNLVVELLPELLPVLLDGALQLIQGVLDAIKGNIEPLMDMVVTVLMQLAFFFYENMPLVIEIGVEILMALINGLVEAIPQLIPAIVQAVITIVDTIIQNLPQVIEAAIQVLLAIVNGLIAALPQLIEWLPTIVESVVDAIIDNLPLIIDAAIKIIVAVVRALVENLPLLAKAAIEIVGTILKALVKAIPEVLSTAGKLGMEIVNALKDIDWKQLGVDMIRGIANGLSNAGSALADAAKKAANGALNSIKKALGIASPSRVFRDEVGLMMGEGIAVGLDKSGRDIDEAFANALPDLERQYDVAFAGESIAAKKRAAAQMQSAQPEPIDYDRLAEAMSRLSVNVDGRQFGRVVKQYA